MRVTILAALLRDVFGNDHARGLLLLVTQRDAPIRYSEAREGLGLHPQEFQRALDRLEDYGLIGLRAPADLNKPHAKRDHFVFLEATVLGSFAASLWERMNADYAARQGAQPAGGRALGRRRGGVTPVPSAVMVSAGVA